jgi:GTP pyrophosphokinase
VPDVEHLHQLLGEGEITATQLVQAAARVLDLRRDKPVTAPARARRTRANTSSSLVEIEGVGDLPITLARCCGPLRPQPILGYVTVGRGVTIHRRECPSVVRMQIMKPERLLQVEWISNGDKGLVVGIAVSAHDRRGLVRDVTDVLALERLSIQAMTTTTDRTAGTAFVSVTVAVSDLDQLARILRRLDGIQSVIHARRLH